MAPAGGLSGDCEGVEDGDGGVGAGSDEVVKLGAEIGVELVGGEGEKETTVKGEVEGAGAAVVGLGPAGEAEGGDRGGGRRIEKDAEEGDGGIGGCGGGGRGGGGDKGFQSGPVLSGDEVGQGAGIGRGWGGGAGRGGGGGERSGAGGFSGSETVTAVEQSHRESSPNPNPQR